MGLGQYDGLGEHCGPHTASSVFLTLLLIILHEFVLNLYALSSRGYLYIRIKTLVSWSLPSVENPDLLCFDYVYALRPSRLVLFTL